MKKRVFALGLALLILCGCGKQPDPEPSEPEPTPTVTGYTATGWNNPDVPRNEFSQEAFMSLGGFTIYTAANAASHIGIDVSTFQGEIDWAQVKAAGVEFAMLRAGGRGYGEHGTIYEDSSFIQNIQGALGAGVEVGVYFFSQAVTEEEAREEAQSVLNWISPYQITYPLVFDWETVEDSAAPTTWTRRLSPPAPKPSAMRWRPRDTPPWSISTAIRVTACTTWPSWADMSSGWRGTPPSLILPIPSRCGSTAIRARSPVLRARWT